MVALSCVRVGIALVLMAMVGHASAAMPSGKVLAVVQSANIDGVTGKKILEPEAPVFAGDRVDTGPVGEAQIRFRDNTRLVVGPNSSMIIDAFVFNDDNTARQISINAVKGAFRFITGTSRKDAYTINTPTATIGVRGTVFDLNIESTGTTRLLNLKGITLQCDRLAPGQKIDRTKCFESSDTCGVSVLRSGRPAEPLKYLPEVVRTLDRYFRYEHDQNALHDEFRADTSRCQEVRELVRFSFSPEPTSPN